MSSAFSILVNGKSSTPGYRGLKFGSSSITTPRKRLGELLKEAKALSVHKKIPTNSLGLGNIAAQTSLEEDSNDGAQEVSNLNQNQHSDSDTKQTENIVIPEQDNDGAQEVSNLNQNQHSDTKSYIVTPEQDKRVRRNLTWITSTRDDLKNGGKRRTKSIKKRRAKNGKTAKKRCTKKRKNIKKRRA